MGKKKEQLSKRLAAISSAKPVEINAPVVQKTRRPQRCERESTFRPAKLFTSSTNFYNCIIVNVSDTGALVRMEGEFGLPATVILRILQTGVTKKAKIVWRDETDIGLHFTEDLTRRPSPSRRVKIAPDRNKEE